MLTKTDGIVLHTIKYGETSIIARIFTREAGMQSYLVRGVRKSGSRTKQMLFRPLTMVSMIAYHKNREGLQNIREISLLKAYGSIPYDIAKTSLAIFLSEILSYSLKNQEANHSLFDFLSESLLLLDGLRKGVANYHLVFLMKLSSYLGFRPREDYGGKKLYFNLLEGCYQYHFDPAGNCLDQELSRMFHSLSTLPLETSGRIDIDREQRRELLTSMIAYYSHHLSGMPEIKSRSVLEAVFD